jgi:hypothetical protein
MSFNLFTMSVPTCFDSIIGFSRKEDVCVIKAWDDAYADSDSGLYVDELPGMPQRFIASLGGNYDIWEKMTNAMDNAVGAFKIDVIGEIYKYWQPSRGSFKGDIGRKSYTTTLSDYTYHGIRMFSDVIGGSYILRGVWLILNVTEAVTLEIYDEYDLLYTYTLNSIAGKPSYTAISPLELSLEGNYYFLYTTSGLPYNNKLTCNCGGHKWCFDTCNPCYSPSRENWTQWAMVGGVGGNDLTNRENWNTSREGAGMILVGDFTCDVFGTLCSDSSDWTTPIGFATANAIWYKTGEFLSTYILDSEEVSRATLLGVEQWNANRNFYNARYVAMIDFIATHFEAEENECLKCRPPFGYSKKAQIL